jgi:hypothetical protein
MAISGYNFYEDGVKRNSALLATPNYVRSGLGEGVSGACYFTAVDEAGNESAPGQSANFTTLVTAPGDTTAPTISNVSVANITQTSATFNAQINEPTLYWAVFPSAQAAHTTGEILAGTGALDFGSISNTGSIQAALMGGLTASTGYKVHYFAEDAAGNKTSVSLTSTFTTQQSVVQLNAPILESVVEFPTAVPPNVTVRWTDTNQSPNEAKYEVEIDTVNTFNSGTANYKRLDATANATSLVINAETNNYDFFARVRAKGNGAETLDSPWSATGPNMPAAPAIWGAFNGTTSQLERVSNMDLTQDFTLEFMFLLNNTTNSVQGLVANQSVAELAGKKGLLCYFQSSSSSVRTSVYNSSGVEILLSSGAISSVTNTWHRVKIEKIGSNLTMIVDNTGVAVSVGTLVNSASNSIRYGTWYDGATSRRLNGRMALLKSTGSVPYLIENPSTGTDTSGNNNNFTVTNVTQGT